MSDKPIQDGVVGPVMLAWAVHILTASGVILALLAIDAVLRDAWREALFWLFLALAIDGVDGTAARKFQVPNYVPSVDGAALDLIVDYLNYVLVPTLVIWRAELVPAPLALPLSGLIMLSALYVFVRSDMKTSDGYFRGFPALWNVVAAYLILIAPTTWICAAIIIVLSLASFAPIHVIHPFRANDYPIAAPSLAVAWLVSSLALLVPHLPETVLKLALAGSFFCLFGLSFMGFWRSVRGPSPQATP